MVTACDYMAVRFGTLNTDFLCGLISSSRACAWITGYAEVILPVGARSALGCGSAKLSRSPDVGSQRTQHVQFGQPFLRRWHLCPLIGSVLQRDTVKGQEKANVPCVLGR